jgi:hypothetical protein
VARLRGWGVKKLLVTPSLLHYIFATDMGFQIVDDADVSDS